MSKNLKPDEMQEKIIEYVYATINECIQESKRSKIKSNESNESNESKMRKFIVCICNSCIGNMDNLYKSFENFLKVEYIKLNDKKYQEYINGLIEIDQTKSEFTKESEKCKNEFEEKQDFIKNIESYLSYTHDEYKDIINDPQFKDINQTEAKTKKRTDKSERINQLIIHDMIYLIDYLNRQMGPGWGSKK